ncbi:helix-turn-helix domain-containing protein [Streptomyces sp. NPDC002054]|uniref:helix-turn-helix domain-containing protein n=1 Tax=Streptomyces sp. NPDC002054 TaxID=3154663 RepID=UPI0033299D4A
MSESDGQGRDGAGLEGVGEPGSVAAARALGVQLRLLRENAKLSQRDLVALLGGSITSVSRYENGERLPRSAYVEALLEEADLRGPAPLTADVRELVTALYERALGPVGGRNSERAALYEQERALREVRDREAEATRLLGDLAAQRQDPRTDTGSRESLDAQAAEVERLSAHLAVQRRQILRRIDRLLAGLPAENAVELEPGPGEPPPPEGVPGLGRSAVPPWGHRSLAGLAAALIAVAAIVWGVVLLQRDNSAPSPSPSPTPSPSSSPTPSESPSQDPASSPPPSPTPPPVTKPPAPTVPAAVAVQWRGTLTLDDGSTTGIPTTGWALDPVPPQRTALGDIALACQLVCEPGRYVGNTIITVDGSGAPARQTCVDLLNTNVGQRTADVPAGRTACFGTRAGRVGHFTPRPGNNGQVKLEVTVWELPT